ncbi:MAG: alkaline phosphatase [Henriciella sp.]|nr:alkaline phosphatase [Henriciella sp.]
MRLPIALTAGLLIAGCSVDAKQETQAVAPSPLLERAELPEQAADPYYVSASEAVTSRMADGFQPKAKNVIIFVGDGMGISTITAGRIYAGQKRGTDGESFKLAMEKLPNAALSRTYSHDYQVADSASTATAMVSGVKTRSRVLGVRSGISVGNCASQEGQGTDSLFELAERKGLATGIVSTARITHATPAATYAESASRDWEDDTSFADGGDDTCKDIARQFIEWPEGDGFEVALGGGRRHFMTDETFDAEYDTKRGRRTDEKDLLAAWSAKSDDHTVIATGEEFAATDFDSDVRVLGLFEPSHMQFELDREADPGTEPALADLTKAAITRLSRDQDGYVLMIEGGRIDHAHHGGNAARALGDTDAFDMAVAMAVEMTDAADTLIIVTADHSHTMTMAGYPRRNNPILGKVAYETGDIAKGGDGKPYTTLGYANGSGACKPGSDCIREDLSDVDTTDINYKQQATVFMQSETHAGEDVAIFASGPGSELVRGVMDQNEIFHVMGYSSGLVAQAAE